MEQEVGAALSRELTTASGERAEQELDAFISRREKQRVAQEGERAEEAAWKKSVRKADAARRKANDAAWLRYHRSAIEAHEATLRALIEKHETEAQKLVGQMANPEEGAA